MHNYPHPPPLKHTHTHTHTSKQHWHYISYSIICTVTHQSNKMTIKLCQTADKSSAPPCRHGSSQEICRPAYPRDMHEAALAAYTSKQIVPWVDARAGHSVISDLGVEPLEGATRPRFVLLVFFKCPLLGLLLTGCDQHAIKKQTKD